MAIMPGEVVRVRAPRRSLLLSHGILFLPFCAMTLNAWGLRRSGASMWFSVFWGVTPLLMVALIVRGLLRPLGVDLRDDSAVVVGPLRRRVVPWRDVQAVAFRRGHDVTLYLADGTEVRCHYPSHDTFVVSWRRVNDDFHRVGQWWLAHRGADWRPVFAPPPYPAPMPFPQASPRSVDEIWRTPPEARR